MRACELTKIHCARTRTGVNAFPAHNSFGLTCLVNLRNFFDAYTAILTLTLRTDAPRFFRSSASTHRILALDGAIRMKELMKKAVEFKMPAVAMTDHGNLFGAIEFYQEAQARRDQADHWCEAYIAPRSHQGSAEIASAIRLITLRCWRKTRPAIAIWSSYISTAHLDGFHYRPRIDKELLAAHSAGLIGLSGCLAGEVNCAIQARQHRKGKTECCRISRHSRGENFFIELHDHGMEEQRKCNACCRRSPRTSALGWSRQTMCTFCAGAITRRTT